MSLRELAVGPAAYQHTCTVASGETDGSLFDLPEPVTVDAAR